MSVQTCCLDQYTSYGVCNAHEQFQGCTVDVQTATLILTTLQQTLHYIYTINVCHDALHEGSVMVGTFQSVRVSVYAHALNLNNQYLTLLKVYKPAAWTSTVHTVLLICTKSLRFVQLMYSPLR